MDRAASKTPASRMKTPRGSVAPRRVIPESTREESPPPVAIEFDPKKIDTIFRELDQCVLPGAAVGIAIHGRPVYRRGFGLANMELPVLLSPSIRMRIGSTTKHFAALAYLLLCEEGRANIDEPIGKHLPEVHAVSRNVTVRQLMAHTSGLRDVHDICYQFSGVGRAISTDCLFDMYRDIDDVNAPVGTTWIYNNGGYVLLSVAIERITGQPLEEVLRKRIFEPLGMYDTMLRRFDNDFVPNSATLHMPLPGGGFEKAHLGSAIAGEGGVVSTVDDMLRWLSHMDAPRIGSPSTWRWMRESQRLANGTPTGYGLGLMIDRYRGVQTLSHPGGVLAGNSQMLKVPAAGLDIVIMVNRGDVYAMVLTERILDACLPDLTESETVASPVFTAGVFRSPSTGRVIQLLAKDGQQIASIDGMDMPVERDKDGIWWPAGIWRYLKQSLEMEGSPESPTAIRFTDFGNRDRLLAVARADERVPWTHVVGRYHSVGIATEIVISGADRQLSLTAMGRFGSVSYRLECLADGIWRARPLTESFIGGVLSFTEDPDMFRFSTFRTFALQFRRFG